MPQRRFRTGNATGSSVLLTDTAGKRLNAALRSLSERSGHRLSGAYRSRVYEYTL
jgi:hypothetical protein